jgi:hypothetical protein
MDDPWPSFRLQAQSAPKLTDQSKIFDQKESQHGEYRGQEQYQAQAVLDERAYGFAEQAQQCSDNEKSHATG